jgi:hypothetical protein
MCACAGKSPKSPPQTATGKSIRPNTCKNATNPQHVVWCNIPQQYLIAARLRSQGPPTPAEQIHAILAGGTTGSPHHKEDVEGTPTGSPQFHAVAYISTVAEAKKQSIKRECIYCHTCRTRPNKQGAVMCCSWAVHLAQTLPNTHVTSTQRVNNQSTEN